MKPLAYILLGWLLTVASSWGLGLLLWRTLARRFDPQAFVVGRPVLVLGLYREEWRLFSLLTGFACYSGLLFVLAALHLVYKGVVLGLAVGICLLVWGTRAWRTEAPPLPPLPSRWRWVFLVVFVPYAVMYLLFMLAPEASPDGATYHLGLVARYARERGFAALTTTMYAHLPAGAELLFLSAFVWGKHSAAAAVHGTFLLVLPLLMLRYGQRIGVPAVGVLGGLLMFCSPIVGVVGTAAYNDVACATVLFALFYLLTIWDREPRAALLTPIGLLAGFAFAIKYTAFGSLPFMLGWLLWRLRGTPQQAARSAAWATGVAMLLVLPWLGKNALLTGNPFVPLLNRYFPNAAIHISFEEAYTKNLRTYGPERLSVGQMVRETFVNGERLQGLLGPVFLLVPLALLALRRREGRQLLAAAAVFGLPYLANIGVRTLLPCMVFAAPALAMAIHRWKDLPQALVLLHGFLSWPTNLDLYRGPTAWQLQGTPLRAVLRQQPEDEYLAERLGDDYLMARAIEQLTPPTARIFSFSNLPDAYTSREILVSYQAAENERLNDALLTPLVAAWQPLQARTFRFAPQPLPRFRVRQTVAAGKDIPSLTELRLFHQGREVPRPATWRVRTYPNPWDAPLAFDNNPITRWRAWQPLHDGMWVEVDASVASPLVDEVRLECSVDQGETLFALEVPDGAGWKTLVAGTVDSGLPAPPALRRAAVDELLSHGIGYLAVQQSNFGAADFSRLTRWNLRHLATRGSWNLYQILPRQVAP